MVGGVPMPRAVAGWFGVPAHGVVAEVSFHVLDGEPVVDDVRVVGTRWPSARPDDDAATRDRLRAQHRLGPTQPVTPAALRAVAAELDRGVRDILMLFAPEYEVDGRTVHKRAELRAVRQGVEQAQARRRMTPDLLAEVATVYRSNEDLLPRQAVAQRWGISPHTASKWIREARDRGYLGAAPAPGVQGEVTRKGSGR